MLAFQISLIFFFDIGRSLALKHGFRSRIMLAWSFSPFPVLGLYPPHVGLSVFFFLVSAYPLYQPL